MTILEFHDVGFGYSEHLTIKNISFTVLENSVTWIKGENGCGKSTLIKLLYKLLPVQEGYILLNGVSIEYQPFDYVKNQFSICPQNDIILPETIELNFIHSIENKKLKQYCNLFGLHVNNKKVNELSGGEVKKLSIIRTFLSKKPILIFDEPLNSLDEESRQVFNQMTEAEHKTIIIISHQLVEVADNIIDISQ